MNTKKYFSRVVRLVPVASLLLGLSGALVVVTATSSARADETANLNPGVVPINAKAFGLSYGEWSARWWQWFAAIPADQHPVLDTTGENCDVDQAGKVWFLAGTTGGAEVRDCEVPAGKAILFPIVNFLAWAPEDGETEQDLLGLGNFFMDAATELEAEIDGIALQDLFDQRAGSPGFAFTGPENPADNIFGLDGGRDLAASVGYWVLLAPLSEGEHEIHFRGVLTFTVEEHGFDFVFETEVTYFLTIIDEDD